MVLPKGDPAQNSSGAGGEGSPVTKKRSNMEPSALQDFLGGSVRLGITMMVTWSTVGSVRSGQQGTSTPTGQHGQSVVVIEIKEATGLSAMLSRAGISECLHLLEEAFLEGQNDCFAI